MEGLQEDIMKEEKLRKRSYTLDSSGQLCIRIPRLISGHVMSVREWGGHRAEKRGAVYIIRSTKYLTRLVEVQPSKDCITTTNTKFIFEYILSRFGCPKILMSDRGSHFLN